MVCPGGAGVVVQRNAGAGVREFVPPPPPRPPPGAAPGPARTLRYADSGRCTLIDCSSPTAIHTANIDEPP